MCASYSRRKLVPEILELIQQALLCYLLEESLLCIPCFWKANAPPISVTFPLVGSLALWRLRGGYVGRRRLACGCVSCQMNTCKQPGLATENKDDKVCQLSRVAWLLGLSLRRTKFCGQNFLSENTFLLFVIQDVSSQINASPLSSYCLNSAVEAAVADFSQPRFLPHARFTHPSPVVCWR